MHHPDIHNIVAAIDDFFLLKDSNYSCKIKPLHMKVEYRAYPDNPITLVDAYGIVIEHCLDHGYICVYVMGLGRDDNTVSIKYFGKDNLLEPIQSIEVIPQGSVSEDIRDAIREIIKQDTNSSKLQVLSKSQV